jgi:multicomponent Na+:H+ antiporter subunit E
LANSITLTPGTITIHLEDGKFGIHAIDAPLGEGIEDSGFVRKLKNIEGGH